MTHKFLLLAISVPAWLGSGLLWIAIILGILIFGKSLFGVVYISQDKVGIINKKFSVGKRLENGAIVAMAGEAGIQAVTLSPGLHFGYWPWKFSVKKVDLVVVPPGNFCQVLSIAGKPLDAGRNLAKVVDCNNFQDVKKFFDNGGQKGQQLAVLTAGSYRINTEVFQVEKPTPLIEVKLDSVGIVTVREGAAIDDGEMAKPDKGDHNHFQNPQAFIDGGGYKGLQISVLQAGRYVINPWFANVEYVPMTDVPVGSCAVVISYVGGNEAQKTNSPDPITASENNPGAENQQNRGEEKPAEEKKNLIGVNAKIVPNGRKGVWADPLVSGKYPINTHVQEVVIVPVTQLALYWADTKTQGHHLDDELSTITLRTKDAFNAKMDVVVIVHIPMKNAPQIVANFGNVQGLVSQVLQSTISSYFRNSAQGRQALDLYQQRQQIQQEAKTYISEILRNHFVECVDVLIDDVVLPDDLTKPLTDREIAKQQKDTYITQKDAQDQRKELANSTALADMQIQVVQSEQKVTIAEKDAEAIKKKADGEAYKIKTEGNATAEITKSIGAAEAEVMKQKNEAMPSYAATVIAKAFAENGIQVIPKIIVNSGGAGGGSSSSPLIEAIFANKLYEDMDKKEAPGKPATTPATPEKLGEENTNTNNNG